MYLCTVSVSMRQGYPVLCVPLPSKRETCEFILQPYLHNVGDFMKFVMAEDKGIDR